MARVVSGLDRLLERPEPVHGLRVGLVCNPSSVTGELVHASIALRERKGVELAALFGPEHGISADAQDLIEVGHSRDRATCLPVHSLYGETRVPTPDMLRDLDAVVFDLQDVGSRYYTFIYTMLHVMEACRLCCRGGKSDAPLASRRRPSCSARSADGGSTATRAASNSIASGRPSQRAHSVATAATLSA